MKKISILAIALVFLLSISVFSNLAEAQNQADQSFRQAILNSLQNYAQNIQARVNDMLSTTDTTSQTEKEQTVEENIEKIRTEIGIVEEALEAVRTLEAETSTSIISTSSPFTRNLSMGMVGEDVRDLQKILNALGFTVAETGFGSMGRETDYYGSLTESAVREFQRSYGQPTTGNIDRNTGELLFGVVCEAPAGIDGSSGVVIFDCPDDDPGNGGGNGGFCGLGGDGSSSPLLYSSDSGFTPPDEALPQGPFGPFGDDYVCTDGFFEFCEEFGEMHSGNPNMQCEGLVFDNHVIPFFTFQDEDGEVWDCIIELQDDSMACWRLFDSPFNQDNWQDWVRENICENYPDDWIDPATCDNPVYFVPPIPCEALQGSNCGIAGGGTQTCVSLTGHPQNLTCGLCAFQLPEGEYFCTWN